MPWAVTGTWISSVCRSTALAGERLKGPLAPRMASGPFRLGQGYFGDLRPERQEALASVFSSVFFAAATGAGLAAS